MHVVTPPTLDQLLRRLGTDGLLRATGSVRSPDGTSYLHWDRIRHMEPPEGLSPEEYWLGIKLSRAANARAFGLEDRTGRPFTVGAPDVVLRSLHRVDRECAGRVSMPAPLADSESARDHYLVNARIEEAIRSSQIEGATTERAVAKEMIRTGRAPLDRSEQMILNNYQGMGFMQGVPAGGLTPGIVIELQRILTEGTLIEPDEAGRLQRPDEIRVSVVDSVDGSPVHDPPPAAQLPERLRRMCAFANAPDDSEPFLHPVVRSILLHLWLAHDHPFAEGNGRTARALFYWSMRVRGFRAAEYLSLSRNLQSAPARYARAFLHAETDECDATYFVVHQLDALDRAIDDWQEYMRRKVEQLAGVPLTAESSGALNHRQRALLAHSFRTVGPVYTHESHARSHRVTPETARTDLLKLVEAGYLVVERRGRRSVYRPAATAG